MRRTHGVMAVLADNRYRFCWGNPVVAHVGVSLSERKFQFPVVYMMVRSHGERGVMRIGRSSINHDNETCSWWT